MGPLILGLLSVLSTLGALGALVYTRLIYHRPLITESLERDKLQKHQTVVEAGANSGTVKIEPITLNILPDVPEPGSKEVPPTHFLVIGFSVELRDIGEKAKFDSVKTFFLDRTISMLGSKSFKDLVTVQGRYVLKSQLIEMANELMTDFHGASVGEIPLITNLYFTQFQVQ